MVFLDFTPLYCCSQHKSDIYSKPHKACTFTALMQQLSQHFSLSLFGNFEQEGNLNFFGLVKI